MKYQWFINGLTVATVPATSNAAVSATAGPRPFSNPRASGDGRAERKLRRPARVYASFAVTLSATFPLSARLIGQPSLASAAAFANPA